MTIHHPFGPLIMGASGRLGQAILRVWPDDAPLPLRQYRLGPPDARFDDTVTWDILCAPAPDMPEISGIIVLAGVTSGTPAELALNTSLALAGAKLGHKLNVPIIIASTQAVYGSNQGLLQENKPIFPIGDYGRAKAAMEAAVSASQVTCLRIGNVAGCDALAQSVGRYRLEGIPLTLDRFADGQGPRRAMLGPRDLVRVLLALLKAPSRPPVLNVARPGLVAMADVLSAVGLPFNWQPAGSTALPELAIDVSLMQSICPLPPADAKAMAEQGGLA